MSAPRTDPEDATLSYYFRLIWAGRRLLIIATLAAGCLTAIVSMLLPPTYQAVTTIIPVSSSNKVSNLADLSTNLEDFGLQTGSKGNMSAMYPEIVRSRRLLEQVLAVEFPMGDTGGRVRLVDLVQPHGRGAKRTELAVKRLRSQIDAVLDRRNGILTIRARARRPEIAAAMANTLDTLLQGYVVRSFTSQAGENRRFIEGRLRETQVDLSGAEENLRSFRERNLRIGNSPRLLLEEGRLARALREQEEIYLTLRRQYELAKVEEHRDVPVINVLDTAAVPTFRYSPRRSLMVVLGLLIGAGLSTAFLIARGPQGAA